MRNSGCDLCCGEYAEAEEEPWIQQSEEKYWRENHDKHPFVKPGHTYERYAPAYKTGYEGAQKHPDKKFEEVEPHLAAEFQKHKSMIEWDAARAAWDKVSGVIQPRDVSRGVQYD